MFPSNFLKTHAFSLACRPGVARLAVCGKAQKDDPNAAKPANPLKDAVRDARIEAAERSGVVVDLRDADVARLELLNEALDPLFKEIPGDVELFDRGVSKGDVPRLWVDVVAHVEMGRDKRQYRFVQDTRYGRAVLAESYEVPAWWTRSHATWRVGWSSASVP